MADGLSYPSGMDSPKTDDSEGHYSATGLIHCGREMCCSKSTQSPIRGFEDRGTNKFVPHRIRPAMVFSISIWSDSTSRLSLGERRRVRSSSAVSRRRSPQSQASSMVPASMAGEHGACLISVCAGHILPVLSTAPRSFLIFFSYCCPSGLSLNAPTWNL